jgi:hypothetical protein
MEWNYVSELRPPTGLLFIPRWFMSMEEWYRQGKLLIRPPELSGNSTSSHLVAKQKELAKEIINLAVRSNGSLTCSKILRHMADGFTSLRREACCGFLSPLKVHRSRPVLNSRTLDPSASTLIITPPRMTGPLRQYNEARWEHSTQTYIWNSRCTWEL